MGSPKSEAGRYDNETQHKITLSKGFHLGIHLITQKKPKDWGLYEMLGNVWEWCQDKYGDYPTKEVVDPQGASTGDYLVLRGVPGSMNLGTPARLVATSSKRRY